MAVTAIDFCGFESGDFLECLEHNGNCYVQSTIKNGLGRALRVNPSGSALGYVSFFDENNGGCVSFYCNPITYPTGSATNDEPIFGMADDIAPFIDLRINSTGKITLYDRNGDVSILASGLGPIPTGNWSLIEFQYLNNFGGGNCDYELRINTVTQATFLVDASDNSIEKFYLGKFDDKHSSSYNIYFDDMFLSDSDFRGHHKVSIPLTPNSNGVYTDWTGNYSDVSQIPNDADATYAFANTNGQSSTYHLNSCDAVGIPSEADGFFLKTATVCRGTGTFDGEQLSTRTYLNGFDDFSTNVDPLPDYSLREYQKVHNFAIDNFDFWHRNTLDMVQIGPYVGATPTSFDPADGALCTAVYGFVDYVPPSSTANSSINFFMKGASPVTGSIPLFLYPTQGATGNVNLYTAGHTPTSGSVNFSMFGSMSGINNINLYTAGFVGTTNSINLIAKTDELFVDNDSVPLSVFGSTASISGQFGSIPLYVNASAEQNSINLFVQSFDVGTSTGNVSLFVGGEWFRQDASVNLSLYNVFVGTGINFFVRASGMLDGGLPFTGSMPFFLQRDPAEMIPFFLQGEGTISSGNLSLYCQGVNVPTGSIPMYMYGVGKPTGVLPMFTRGF